MSQSQKRPRTRPAKPVRDLPLLSRLVLFFTPCRRKVLGFAGLVATWLLLGLFPDAGPWHPLVLAREAAGAAVTVFAVVLVELNRGYRPAAGRHPWRHQDAVKHLKFRPAVLVFAVPGPEGTGARIHAFSQDGQRTGLYDVLSLADEMAAGALAAAREATIGAREAEA